MNHKKLATSLLPPPPPAAIKGRLSVCDASGAQIWKNVLLCSLAGKPIAIQLENANEVTYFPAER